MNYLVGHTGFVGANIYDGLHDKSDWLGFNQSNIHQSFSATPNRLVYAGVQARKYWANANAAKDFKLIEEALANIRKINAKQTLLISSVDVYPKPIEVDEASAIDSSLLEPYAYNRRWLEEAVLHEIPNSKVVRLPALYGINLKKNFIFDLIHFVPSILPKDKFAELSSQNQQVTDFYELNSDNQYCLKTLSEASYLTAINVFKTLNFNALHFTDSRAIYQFYPLKHLAKHLNLIFEQPQAIFNLAVEGISVHEIMVALGVDFINHIHENPSVYNMKTRYAQALERVDREYLFDKAYIKSDLIAFIRRYKKW